jgi:hypothetical protein
MPKRFPVGGYERAELTAAKGLLKGGEYGFDGGRFK